MLLVVCVLSIEEQWNKRGKTLVVPKKAFSLRVYSMLLAIVWT